MSNKLDWLNDIEFEDLFSGDMKLIADKCGIDVLLSLLTNVPHIHVYLSEAPLMEARKRYIEKHYRQGNAKLIAVTLGVSEFYVYKTHKEIIKSRHQEKPKKEQPTLFN